MEGKKKVEQFEDLIAWQKARLLTREIYEITRSVEFSKDFGLRDQMRRAAVSIMSNLAEGFERQGLSEFHQFLSVAKGSSAELRSQLYVAKDVQYLDAITFDRVLGNTKEVGRIIGGLRASIQRQRDNHRAKTRNIKSPH